MITFQYKLRERNYSPSETCVFYFKMPVHFSLFVYSYYRADLQILCAYVDWLVVLLVIYDSIYCMFSNNYQPGVFSTSLMIRKNINTKV